MEQGGDQQKNLNYNKGLNSYYKKGKNQQENSHTRILCPSVTNCFTGFGQSRSKLAMYEKMSNNEMDNNSISTSNQNFGKSEYQSISQMDQQQQQQLQQLQQQQYESIHSDQTYSDINLLDDDDEEVRQQQDQEENAKLPFWRSKLTRGHRSSSDASSSSTFMRFFHRKGKSSDTVAQDTINVGRMYGNMDDSLTSQTSISDLLSSTSPYPQQDLQDNQQHDKLMFLEDAGQKQQQQLTSQIIEEHQQEEQQHDENENMGPKRKRSLWKSVGSKLSMFRNMGSLDTSSRDGGSQKEGGGGGSGSGSGQGSRRGEERNDEAKTPADVSKVEEMQLEMAIAESKRLHRGMGSIEDMDCGDPEGAYVDAGVRLQDDGWWRKRICTRANEHSVALDVDVFYAQFDQRSSKAEGYAACACMSVVLAEWLLQNPGKLPVDKDQIEQLLLTGARDWQLIQQSLGHANDSNRSHENDGHIYLETALEQPGRQATLVTDGQFVVFLRPMEGGSNTLDCPPLEEYLSSTPSMEEIWNEMEKRAPCVFIVAWNEHFALLEFMEDGSVFFVDTLGDRLHEGCDRAYILRFPCTPSDKVPEESPMRRIHSAPNISMSLPMHNGSPSSSLDPKHRRLQSIDEGTDEKFQYQEQVQPQISYEDFKGGANIANLKNDRVEPRSQDSSASHDDVQIQLQEEQKHGQSKSIDKNQSKFSRENLKGRAKTLFFKGKQNSKNSSLQNDIVDAKSQENIQSKNKIKQQNGLNQEEKTAFLGQDGKSINSSVASEVFQDQTLDSLQYKTKAQIDQILSQSNEIEAQNQNHSCLDQNQHVLAFPVSSQNKPSTQKSSFQVEQNYSESEPILSQKNTLEQQNENGDENLIDQDDQDQDQDSPVSASLDVAGRKKSVPIQLGLQPRKEPTLLNPKGGADQCRAFLQHVYTHTPVYELGTRYEAARKRGVAPLDWFLDCQQVIMKTLQIEFRQLKVANA